MNEAEGRITQVGDITYQHALKIQNMEEELGEAKKTIQKSNDPNIRVTGVLEDLEREFGLKNVFSEITHENLENLQKARGKQPLEERISNGLAQK